MMATMSHSIHGLSHSALLQSYRDRFEQIHETERRKDELLVELIQQNEHLSKQLERIEYDLEREQTYARGSQKKIRELEIMCGDAEQKLLSYPYIQVLVDGDGMLFHLDLLKKKKDGGSEAAELLLQEIRELVRSKKEELCIKGDFEIRALVFANLEGLSKSLVRSNLLKPGDLQQFFMGFTQRLEHVNFVDVGYGKEMADSKIRGEFLFHMKDPRCRLILFGGSHDNGYAPFLKTCTATNPNYPIWLVEGSPMGKEVASMSLPSFEFANIFSKETQQQLGSVSPISPPAVLTPTTASLNGASNNGEPKFSYASAAVAPSPTLIRPTSIKYNSSPTVETTKTITISGSGTTLAPAPPVMGVQHTMIPSADAERVNYIKSLNPRACNNWYLKGSCYNTPCAYSHKYKFSKEDVRTLKYIIERSKPCQMFQKYGACTDEKCYYGHQCPFKTGSDLAMAERCKNYNCRFCNED